MTTTASYPVAFRARPRPLTPIALYAEGAVARRVLERLAHERRERLGALQCVATRRCVVLLGPEPELPWADGVIYLGRDARAPLLLVPTYYEPDVPYDVLERRVVAAGHTPIAVLPHARQLIPLGNARAVERDALLAWLRGPMDVRS
jgi:hypothetical protein